MALGADPRVRAANARPMRGARPIASGCDRSPRALSEGLTAAKVPSEKARGDAPGSRQLRCHRRSHQSPAPGNGAFPLDRTTLGNWPKRRGRTHNRETLLARKSFLLRLGSLWRLATSGTPFRMRHSALSRNAPLSASLHRPSSY
jgi:hypothetical protein